MLKKLALAALILMSLTGCSSVETTVKEKNYIAPSVEQVDCRHERVCPDDGFIEVTKPACWELVFNDMGGDIRECVPRKVWEKTTVGEVWHSESYKEKSR